jgi:hypothetical protein
LPEKKRNGIEIHSFLPAAVHTTHGEKLPERKQTPEMRRDEDAAAVKLRKAKSQTERRRIGTATNK